MSSTAAAPTGAAPSSPAEEESINVTTRLTKDGRKISYRLRVAQQPERARACGQGAKSSSDRRPVDPPPIVELRVLEGDQQNDITFPYNASFFLFATLEPARPIAQPRGPHAQTTNAVLTGAPAVGISYLDRPEPAGYFIFPDLSVRHEGQYRLKFTLFEAMKDAHDADAHASNIENIDSSYHNRCEVKSAPFQVFSAKKFPGLTESTLLSRVVADQGCRVRIRRDVRMRRRDSKQDKDWDAEDESQTVEGSRGDLGPTRYDTKPPTSPIGGHQDHMEQVGKMESVPSSTSTQTLPAPPQPSQSVQQVVQAGFSYPQWYQYAATAQQNPQQPYPQQDPAEQAYVQQQQYQNHYSNSEAQQMVQVTQYNPTYAYQQNAPETMVQNAPNAFSTQSQDQQQQSQQNQQPISPVYVPQQQQDYSSQPQMRPPNTVYNAYSTVPRDSQPNVQYPYAHTSLNYTQPQPPNAQAQQHHQMQQQPSQQPLPFDTHGTMHAHSNLSIGKPLPPLEGTRVSHSSTGLTDAAVSPVASRHPSAPTTSHGAPPPHNPYSSYAHSLHTHANNAAAAAAANAMNNQQLGRPPPPQFLSTPGVGLGQKRSYASTFDPRHTMEALRDGGRPQTDNVPEWNDGTNDDDLQDLESIKMSYRRADGSYTLVSPRQFRVNG